MRQLFPNTVVIGFFLLMDSGLHADSMAKRIRVAYDESVVVRLDSTETNTSLDIGLQVRFHADSKILSVAPVYRERLADGAKSQHGFRRANKHSEKDVKRAFWGALGSLYIGDGYRGDLPRKLFLQLRKARVSLKSVIATKNEQVRFEVERAADGVDVKLFIEPNGSKCSESFRII